MVYGEGVDLSDGQFYANRFLCSSFSANLFFSVCFSLHFFIAVVLPLISVNPVCVLSIFVSTSSLLTFISLFFYNASISK